MKVLLLAASGRYIYTHRAHLVRLLRDAGYEVVVVAPGASQYFDQPCDAVVIDRTNTNPFKEIKILCHLVQLYRRYKPDVVHHVGLKPALLGSVAAWICQVPCVVHAVSGLGAALDAGFVRVIIRIVMRVFWRHSTALVQNEVDELFVQGLVKRVIKLPGAGVDLQAFKPPVSEPDTNPFVVTLASRLLWNKGVGLFVEAVAQLRKEGLPIEGWLVGGVDDVHPQAIPLDQLYAWNDTITWLGQRDDVAALYQKSHVVALPTLYREGVPKALIEAAACGRPILTTNRPGCNQVVTDGVNGFFVETVDDIVQRLRQLYVDSELRQKMGQASRLHAEQAFDERNVSRLTIEAYSTFES